MSSDMRKPAFAYVKTKVQISYKVIAQLFVLNLSRIMRKPAFCICEIKGADQLQGNRADDQCLCLS